MRDYTQLLDTWVNTSDKEKNWKWGYPGKIIAILTTIYSTLDDWSNKYVSCNIKQMFTSREKTLVEDIQKSFPLLEKLIEGDTASKYTLGNEGESMKYYMKAINIWHKKNIQDVKVVDKTQLGA